MTKRKVLLIEDNALNRALVAATLRNEYDLLVAATIPEARVLLATHQFDLFLFDIDVPGGGGAALLQELDAGGRARPPAIAVTALAMVGDRERLLAAGFDEYVSKPFDTRAFRATVARLAAVPARGRSKSL